MGWDVELKIGEEIVEVPQHAEGGMISCNPSTGEIGTTQAYMSVTYNYSEFYYKTLPEGGFRALNGMTAEDSIPLLEGALFFLRGETDPDYWKPTQGNAGHILKIMLGWAKLHPKAKWEIE